MLRGQGSLGSFGRRIGAWREGGAGLVASGINCTSFVDAQGRGKESLFMLARVPCLVLAQEIMFSQCQDSDEWQLSLDTSNYTRVFIERAMSHAVTIAGPITSIPSFCPLAVSF